MRATSQVIAVATGAALLAGCGSSSSGGAISVSATPPSTVQQVDATKANLRNLATAEESYLTDNASYTTSSAGISDEGFTREPGTAGDTLIAGVDGSNGYCLIGSPSAGDVWLLYDSMTGGLQDVSYATQSDAEAACSQPKITDFQTLALTATAPSPPAGNAPALTSPAIADTRANLRNLAVSEEVYLTDFGRYTSDSAGLAREGFTRAPGTDSETLLAGVDGSTGYCLVGGTTAAGPWLLYDSQAGGLSFQVFGQESAAEATCSDPAISDYARIS